MFAVSLEALQFVRGSRKDDDDSPSSSCPTFSTTKLARVHNSRRRVQIHAKTSTATMGNVSRPMEFEPNAKCTDPLYTGQFCQHYILFGYCQNQGMCIPSQPEGSNFH
ncbi:hypothetical protein TCAL_15398 [Tigriopus californicus]|uniref:Uncharacterized protein n=1 Tax=Tigriopus californicus TaxID=6832 RepID=A0A553PL51_TIGCA|nr:hypothetical protein TCAL_15398 [Tigriopus californicus]